VTCHCRPAATPHLAHHRRPAQLQQQQQRWHLQQLLCYASSSVGAEEAKRLIEREGYKILDVRSALDYDNKHITKPARCSLNAPVVMNDNVTPNARFLAEVGLMVWAGLVTQVTAVVLAPHRNTQSLCVYVPDAKPQQGISRLS
jgi:rhodanese-related sulfurtransferase